MRVENSPATGSDEGDTLSFLPARLLGCVALPLIALVLVAYLPTMRTPFWDTDEWIHVIWARRILAHPTISVALDTWGVVLRAPKGWSDTLHLALWVPLTACFGENPLGYHLTSVFLHTVASLLIAWLAWIAGARPRAVLFAGIAYAVLPLHYEAVSMPANLDFPLSICLGLASWIALLASIGRRSGRPRVGPYLASLFFFCLGCMTKELVFPMPALFALHLWIGSRFAEPARARRAALLVLPHLLVLAPFAVRPFAVAYLGGQAGTLTVPADSQMLTDIANWLRPSLFLRSFAYILPSRLVFPYSSEPDAHAPRGFFFAVVLTLFLLAAGLLARGSEGRWNRRLLVLGFASVLLLYAPVFYIAERLYFEYTSLFTGAALGYALLLAEALGGGRRDDDDRAGAVLGFGRRDRRGVPLARVVSTGAACALFFLQAAYTGYVNRLTDDYGQRIGRAIRDFQAAARAAPAGRTITLIGGPEIDLGGMRAVVLAAWASSDEAVRPIVQIVYGGRVARSSDANETGGGGVEGEGQTEGKGESALPVVRVAPGSEFFAWTGRGLSRLQTEAEILAALLYADPDPDDSLVRDYLFEGASARVRIRGAILLDQRPETIIPLL